MGEQCRCAIIFLIFNLWHGMMTRPHSEGWNRPFTNDHLFSQIRCETGHTPLLDEVYRSHLFLVTYHALISDADSPFVLIVTSW